MAIESREQGNLIGSDKVEGTAVYGADNEKIGSIERVMIDKISGKVSYAVLSFGGFFGIGDDHYPLPWQSLKYDTNLGGYRTGVTQQQLEGAPKYGNDNSWDWADSSRTSAVNSYYGIYKTTACKDGYFSTEGTRTILSSTILSSKSGARPNPIEPGARLPQMA
jgi:hypothetical protein